MTQPLGYDTDLGYERPPYVPNLDPRPLPPIGVAPEPVHPPSPGEPDDHPEP